MFASMARVIASAVLFSLASAEVVVVSGATGQTGSLVYKALQQQGKQVRGLVRNVTKARDLLGCVACDASEGIFVGDVTVPSTLTDVMAGATSLIIATAAPLIKPDFNDPSTWYYPTGAYPVNVDFKGGKNQLAALAEATNGTGHIVLISSIGTTMPNTFFDTVGHGQMLFYKLNLEADIMSSRLQYSIVKPCGLLNGEAGQSELFVAHDDEGTVDYFNITRADVARVTVEALSYPGVRFDLCSQAGTPTTDLSKLMEAAQRPWLRSSATSVLV
jgi:hypothetical protein